MKWIFLAFAIFAVLPLSWWLRKYRQHAPKIWVLVGILPFMIGPFHLYMAIISWAEWPGYVKGFEVTVLDFIGVAIYLSLPRSMNRLPFRFAMGAYFFAIIISAFQASVPEAALFYPWQSARMFLLFAVTAKACSDITVPHYFLKGLAIGICLEALLGIWQRFVLGELQVVGTFGHQNSLGMVSHFVVFPLLALLMAGKRGWEPISAPIAGVTSALLSVSRATLGLAGLGYTIMFILSSYRRWTFRKGILAIVGAGSIAIVAALATASLGSRFAVVPIVDSYDERAAFENAASMILSDHPLGIGANNYVVVANIGGYNTRAGVASIQTSLSAHVHNVYRLVAAETGYFGLITFLLLLLQPLCIAFVSGWSNRKDIRGDLLLGIGVSLATVYLHSFFEWVFVNYYVQYLFAAELGLIAGLAGQLRSRPPTKLTTAKFLSRNRKVDTPANVRSSINDEPFRLRTEFKR